MRECSHGTKLLKSEDKIVGISLGHDICSEHEVGIAGIKKTFGIGLTKTIGIRKNSIVRGQVHKSDLIKGEKLYRVYSSVRVSTLHPTKLKRITSHPMGEEVSIIAAWDENDFFFAIENVHPEVKEFLTLFEDALDNKDVVVASVPDLETSGLSFIIFSLLPYEIVGKGISKAKKEQDAQRLFDASKAVKLLLKNKEAFDKEHKDSTDNPFRYFALSPRLDEDGKLIMWLNPYHQQHLSSGWFSEEDIQEWATGTPGKIIQSKDAWDELLYICSTPSPVSLQYLKSLLPKFRGVEAKYHNPYNNREVFLNEVSFYQKTGKFSKAFITHIEAHVKAIYKSFWESFYDNRIVEERVIGIFEGLSLFGLGMWDAINSPEIRENLPYWNNLLRYESYWDYLKEKGKAYEPWVKGN